MLPSPERAQLCEKIGFPCNTDDNKQVIGLYEVKSSSLTPLTILISEHRYNMRIGNISLTLLKREQEIAVLTLTQFNLFFKPNFSAGSYRVQAKIEGVVVEGASAPIISSEHTGDSPAYFFKYELEKLEHPSNFTHKMNLSISSIEVLYQKVREHSFQHQQLSFSFPQVAFDEIMNFLDNKQYVINGLTVYMKKLPKVIHNFIEQKLHEKWDLNFDITVPFLVLPESGAMRK